MVVSIMCSDIDGNRDDIISLINDDLSKMEAKIKSNIAMEFKFLGTVSNLRVELAFSLAYAYSNDSDWSMTITNEH